MCNKLTLFVGLLLSAITFTASAQKTYTEGVITYTVGTKKQESKIYFRGDSSLIVNPGGPVKIKVISSSINNYYAVLVNIPLLSTKKAAILGPEELSGINKNMPDFIFSKTNETKQINGFNCKKFYATDRKKNKSYIIWVTNDVAVPPARFNEIYANLDGFPIQCISMVLGKPFVTTVKSISEEKVPADAFIIPADYEINGYDQIQGMSSEY